MRPNCVFVLSFDRKLYLNYPCDSFSPEALILSFFSIYIECAFVSGTSFQFVVTFTAGQPEAHLECVPCPGDRFEPERTNSSLTSITAGCTYVHVPQDNLSSHLVLFERGSKSKPSLYVCDYKNNYHERNGIVFVDDIPTRTYDCDKKFCPIGFLLHPGRFKLPYLFGYNAGLSLFRRTLNMFICVL